MFEQATDSTPRRWKLSLALIILLIAVSYFAIWLLRMTRMPLKSYSGEFAPTSAEEQETGKRLSADVHYLSSTIGDRNLLNAGSLDATALYLKNRFQLAGYSVDQQNYFVAGHPVSNLEAQVAGSETGSANIVVGAHYDSVANSPGANDNATGVAAVLELARRFHGSTPRRTVRFVLFVNEEPPYFHTDDMGSLIYARALRKREVPVAAMISIETIGYYSDADGSQKYPGLLATFYPKRGNFIGFVANPNSRPLLHTAIRKFRETTNFPSEGIAAPEDWPGIGWSDHWSFWQEHYPAIMVTDTALFRYPYYHTSLDTENRVDFARMSRVVNGLHRVVQSMATE
jgi:Zn-dependent M28 family amino/carboxypeptidase